MQRALVLAGGGVAGIAWELGVLRGFGDVDAALQAGILGADVIVGTSAGSAVAAQITSSATIEELYAAQLRESSTEIDIDLDLDDLVVRFTAAVSGATGPEDRRRRIGTLALETPTVSEAERRAAIAARLHDASWPDRRLLVTAVDAGSGDLTVFTRESGVELVDAVAASCAVPGVWPPVTIGGIRYIDGGVRSGSNADLAAGCEQVLVITPTRPDAPQLWGSLDDEIEALKPADVHVIHADGASTAAFGTNPLALATRRPAALAGRAVGRARAQAVGAFWR